MMTTTNIAPSSAGASANALRAGQASFWDLLGAELFKLLFLRLSWVLAGLYLLFLVGAQLVLASGSDAKRQLLSDPLDAFYNLMEGDLSLIRIFGGIVLLILAAYVVGLEYQYGTIRILLGRGVGRLSLLGAKLLALALAALTLLATGLLVDVLFGWAIVTSLAGGQQPWRALGPEYWTDVWVYLFAVFISMAATLLLGVAVSVAGRSLAFGLTAGLCWFAVDNLVMIPLALLAQVTHRAFWLNLTDYLLGPLLNRLPDVIAPPYHVSVPGNYGPRIVTHSVSGFGPLPRLPVTPAHAFAVIGGYCLVFAVTAIVLTWRRDVRE